MGLLSLSPYSAAASLGGLVTESTHIALFLSDPIAAGSMASEQADANGYVRQAVSWTSSGGESEVTNALIEFEPSGAGWTGPWYVGLVNSGTHGAGQVIAVMIDPDTGLPVTTFDMAGIASLAAGQKLQIPSGELKFQVGEIPALAPLDPVAEILAMQPTLFWIFDRAEYNSVQLLYQDDAATTPVTSNGDPVGCAKDLVLGREFTQSTSGSRPEYGAGVGLIFDGSNDYMLGEDCSDLLAQASTGDTKTLGITLTSDADDQTSQRVVFNNAQAAQQARLGVAAGGGFYSVTDVNIVVDYADFYQKKHAVVRAYQHLTTTYANEHSNGSLTTSYITFENPCLGRYGHSTASQYWLGSVACLVFFDRLLNIPELARLQRMLLRIGQ